MPPPVGDPHHPKITPEIFHPGMLKPERYTREEICAAILAHINSKGDDLTPKQREGLDRFKYTGTWNLGDIANNADLKKFFDIYNDVFFNGILIGYVNVLEFVDRESCVNRVGCRLDGYCSLHYPGPRVRKGKQRRAYTEIYIAKTPGHVHRAIHIFWLLGTLLHEMLHAAFGIYSCYCDSCGDESHDVNFCAVAKALEEQTNLSLLSGLKLELDFQESFCLDVFKGIFTLPNDVKLRRAGIDINKFWKRLTERRNTDQTSEPREGGPSKFNPCIRGMFVKGMGDSQFT